MISTDAHDPIITTGRGETNFDAKFITLVRLALGDTFYFRRMDAVHFVMIIFLLVQQSLG